jgi:hypothetical protein
MIATGKQQVEMMVSDEAESGPARQWASHLSLRSDWELT